MDRGRGDDTGTAGLGRACRVLRRLREVIAPPAPELSDEERRALARRLAAAFGGEDALVAEEAAQAAETDPANPFARVQDLASAYDFVLAHYPPHKSPREQAVALAFAVVVEHVRYTARDAATGQSPTPADLDRFLDDHAPVALVAALRAGPCSWVRRSMKRLRKEVGGEDNLEALVVAIVARYGRRGRR